MKMNEQHQTVFQLNSDGITLLQGGDYVDAISKLQEAMRAMRAIVHDPARPGFKLLPIEGYGGQIGNDVIEDVSTVSVPAGKEWMDQSRMALSNMDTLFQFFDMAFTTVFMDYQGTRGLRLTCCLILYNLGLSFHRREIVNGTMNPEKLQTAIKFYNRALRIIEGAFQDGRQEDLTLLILAIFNNMGHVCALFGSVEECKHCIGWIRSLLSTIECGTMAMTRPDIRFFYQNPLFLVGDNIFHKAAAA